jgi:hypothetical protein
VATGLAVALLTGWEGVLRSLGHRPTVVDDMALWAAQRDRVYGDCCEKPIVLLGDCRMQLDFVPQIMAGQFPGHRVIQLAIEQTSPAAVLRDLAADERFNGVVVCAVNGRLLCRDMWESQQPYVDYYHKKHDLNERLNRFLASALQARLTFLHPQLRLDKLVIGLLKTGRLPSPFYIETRADRSRLADYSHVDIQAYRQWALGRDQWLCANKMLPTSVLWLREAQEIEKWVRTIQARGGQVIFVQFPTTGEHLRYDEYMFPKAQFWDAFAAQTSAPCIHFRDLPQLSTFDCPDWSHLDRKDAPRFTLELAKVLESRGLRENLTCAATRGRIANKAPQCACCSVSGPS